MKKKYRIKGDHINGMQAFDRVCHTNNISNLMKLLGEKGFVIQNYYEVDGDQGDSVIELECKRRRSHANA